MMNQEKVVPYFARDRVWHPKAYTPDYKSSVLRSPQKALFTMPQSLSEVSGPVFGHNIIGKADNDLIHNSAEPGQSAIGERLIVHGRVLDENGKGVSETLVEFWQANAAGRYRHVKEGYMAPLDPNFAGLGRTLTDKEGNYYFRTIKPGPYPWPNGVNDWRPSHIHFSVFGPAFSQRLITQMYFEGDPLIARCPIANTINDPKAITQLTALLDVENSVPFDALCYRFDIVVRGRRQTFFES